MRLRIPALSRETRRIRIHLAQPMTEASITELGETLVDDVVAAVTYDAEVIATRIEANAAGEPIFAQIVIVIVAHTPGDAYGLLIGALEERGTARGSWIDCSGEQVPIGNDHVMLLRCGSADALVVTEHCNRLLPAQAGWVEDSYAAADGMVLVLFGPSRGRLTAALEQLLLDPAFLGVHLSLPSVFEPDTLITETFDTGPIEPLVA